MEEGQKIIIPYADKVKIIIGLISLAVIGVASVIISEPQRRRNNASIQRMKEHYQQLSEKRQQEFRDLLVTAEASINQLFTTWGASAQERMENLDKTNMDILAIETSFANFADKFSNSQAMEDLILSLNDLKNQLISLKHLTILQRSFENLQDLKDKLTKKEIAKEEGQKLLAGIESDFYGNEKKARGAFIGISYRIRSDFVALKPAVMKLLE